MKLIDFIAEANDKITVSVVYMDNVYYFQVYRLTADVIIDGLWKEVHKREIKLHKIAEINKELAEKELDL